MAGLNRFTNKAVIVAGAASGIGAATVLEFALEGAAVAVFDINRTLGETYASQLMAEGLHVQFYPVNVADADACRAAAHDFAAKQPNSGIDALVNCAVSFIAKGLGVTTAEWEHSLGVNVRGCSNMVQACFDPMCTAGKGAIVNTASISGHIAQPNRSTYNATKGAILAMTKCQALDLAPYEIRVNVVSPGWIWTPEVQKAANNDRVGWEPI